MMKKIWTILGIEPTTDTRAIKKAYAVAVKGCHQEDEPERWQELHEAYQQALAIANGQGGKPHVNSITTVKPAKATVKSQSKTPEKPQEKPVEKKESVEQPKEIRQVKLEFAEESEKEQKEPDVSTEQFAKEQGDYTELFKKIDRTQRREERLERMTQSLYKLIELPTTEQKRAFERYFENPKLEQAITELIFWQALSRFVKSASMTAEVYAVISQKVSALIADENRNFKEEVLAEMRAVQMVCAAKQREKKKADEEKQFSKPQVRHILFTIMGLIIVGLFLVMLGDDGTTASDWGRFIVRLLRTIVRIL